MNVLRIAIILAFCFASLNSFACSFDTDCNVGSKCVKSSGSLYGVCAGGMNPGNTYDSTPVTDPLDIDRSYGNICSFNTDCGVSNKCYKERGNIKGVCVKSH